MQQMGGGATVPQTAFK